MLIGSLVGDNFLLRDFRPYGKKFMNECVLITVAMVMLLWDFGPYGKIFLCVFTTLDFPVNLDRKFTSILIISHLLHVVIISPMRSILPAHFIILDLITQTILVENCKQYLSLLPDPTLNTQTHRPHLKESCTYGTLNQLQISASNIKNPKKITDLLCLSSM
jgi:hypothetical protein